MNEVIRPDFLDSLWTRLYRYGVVRDFYLRDGDSARLLKAMKLYRRVSQWRVNRQIRAAIDQAVQWIIEGKRRLRERLLLRFVRNTRKKNRYVPKPEDMSNRLHHPRDQHGFLRREYLVSAGLSRRAYELYRALKNGALPDSVVGRLNMHLYFFS